MAAFLVSWLPYVIDAVIDAYMNFITPPYVYEILVWCVYYNSAKNLLIYPFFYPWFWKAIKLIVSGKVLRSDSSTTNLFSEEVETDLKHYCGDLKTNLKLRSSAKTNTWT